jgi:NADH-quinone oxidoreductase subunit J
MDHGVILFYFLALLTIASALVVILHPVPMYCAMGLVNTLFLLAVMFVLLDAHLVAFLQVIVYAGAIVVLFLFVIMLLSLEAAPRMEGRFALRAGGTLLALLLAVELGIVTVVHQPPVDTLPPPAFGSTVSLAERLFSTHLLPFELTSVLLLVAIVGAVVMARRKV